MWYAIEFAPIIRADVYEFTSRRLRDAWVAQVAPSRRRERRAVSARHPLVRRTPRWGRIDGDSAAWRVLALARVERSPNLERYRSVIMYDWPETEHWRWITTAPEREVIEWARAIEKEASVE